LKRGYEIAGGSLMIACEDGIQEWRFVAIALNKNSGSTLPELASELNAFDGVDSFQLSHARN
jgi:putative Mg2+ transporter-C (MgtC) family protein